MADILKLPKVRLTGCELVADLENSREHDILIFIYGEELQKQFNSVVKDRCNGCQTEHPSQSEHLCLTLKDSCVEADGIITEALAKVDLAYVKALCVETANILSVDANWLLACFDHLIKGLQKQWEQFRRFAVVVSAMENMWDMNFTEIRDLMGLIKAVNTARVKVNKLEERFSRLSLTE